MSFILRTIFKEGDSKNTEINREIGDVFQVVNREHNYEEFQKHYKKCFGWDHLADLSPSSDNFMKNTYAILIIQGGELVPLYKKQHNYIMTGDGKTFSNLTYREGKKEC